MSINFYSNNASHNSSTVADTPPNLISKTKTLVCGEDKKKAVKYVRAGHRMQYIKSSLY